MSQIENEQLNLRPENALAEGLLLQAPTTSTAAGGFMENRQNNFKVLVAEDDPISRRLLESFLGKWGYTAIATSDGSEAWQILVGPDSPSIAILDWMMPKMDGLKLCRKIRGNKATAAKYVILLTARAGHGDTVQGLQAGADDFVSKPFNADELRARVQVGARVVGLQSGLAERVLELEEAMAKVKQLQGLVPICSYCKKIRNDNNYWQQVECYISEHSEAQFSHGICPDCLERVMQPARAKVAPSGDSML